MIPLRTSLKKSKWGAEEVWVSSGRLWRSSGRLWGPLWQTLGPLGTHLGPLYIDKLPINRTSGRYVINIILAPSLPKYPKDT